MPKTYKHIMGQFRESVRNTIVSHPDLSYAQIAKLVGVSEVTVYTIAAEFGVSRIKTGPKPGWKKAQREVV